jgi:hypothetical protein
MKRPKHAPPETTLSLAISPTLFGRLRTVSIRKKGVRKSSHINRGKRAARLPNTPSVRQATQKIEFSSDPQTRNLGHDAKGIIAGRPPNSL